MPHGTVHPMYYSLLLELLQQTFKDVFVLVLTEITYFFHRTPPHHFYGSVHGMEPDLVI